MQVKTTYKDIWKISFPIMLGGIAQTVLNVTDTAFLARVGEVELGASAIGGVFYFVLVMLGIGISIGAQIIIARRAGEGKKHAIGEIFDHTLILLTALGLVLFVFGIYLTPTLYHHIIKDSAVAEASIVFIHYRSYALVFTMTSFAVRALFIGIAETRIITYNAVLCAVLNVVLDYILIFGKLGFEPMGIKGAGIATASAEIISALYVFIWAFYKKGMSEYYIFKFTKIAFENFKHIINISSPIVLQNLISMGAWFIFFVLIEKIGRHELAISNIIRSCYMVMMTPVWGFSSACNSMVSNIIGQKKQDEVMPLVLKFVKLSFGLMTLMMALCLLFPNLLLSLSTSDLQLQKDAMGCYYITIIASLIFSVSMNLLSAISGTGNTKKAMVIEITNIVLYLSYIFVFTIVYHSSVEVVWISEIIYWTSMGLWSYIYLKSNKWKSVVV